MSRFGQKIKNLRVASNLTSKVACQAVGIPQSRLIELERGIRLPTEGQVQRMAAFYGVEAALLTALLGPNDTDIADASS